MGEANVYTGSGMVEMPVSIQKSKTKLRRSIPKAGGLISNFNIKSHKLKNEPETRSSNVKSKD